MRRLTGTETTPLPLSYAVIPSVGLAFILATPPTLGLTDTGATPPLLCLIYRGHTPFAWTGR